jgi:uncharacterized protein
MPVAPAVSYPGVYIQEVKSEVHSIVPVDTATAAFIGRALRGPVNQPTVINSFADFQRIFGGLWADSGLGFAVNQFFLNGGSKAVIVRLYHAAAPGAGGAKIAHEGLPLQAKTPGAWGNSLAVRVTCPDPKIVEQLEKKYSVNSGSLFNLAVHDAGTGVTEAFNDLTAGPGPRQVAKVLEAQSTLIAVDPGGTLAPMPKISPDAAGNVWDAVGASTRATPASGGDSAALDAGDLPGDAASKTGLYALEDADIFNLLYIPPDQAGASVDPSVLAAAAAYCEKRRAFLLIDPPVEWTGKEAVKKGFPIPGVSGNSAAVYFPNILAANPLRDNQLEAYGPGAAVAGIFARTDATRGVWKAPAGLEATLKGVSALTVKLTDAENGELNPLGINCLRQMPAAGYVVWGARTIEGDDRLASQWKYIPVRRTALFIEESLYRGSQWAVFEPNDEPLWSQLRLNIGVFMHGLFRQGAFQGQSPQEAYFVKCDKNTTTQADIDRGIVNIVVGFAPLKPAEFVILYIQQAAGQLAA